jgi:hypothetical protein
MAGVRPLATGDIPAVAQLFSRVYPEKRWTSAAEGARAVGFIGVVPRPMRLRGRALDHGIKRIAAFVQRKKIPLTA